MGYLPSLTVTVLAQCFGMLPVTGITGEDFRSLRFRWWSKRTIYSIIFAASSAFNTVMQLLKIINAPKLEFGLFVTLLFFACTFVTVVIFINLATKWPHLMDQWAQVDQAMTGYGFPVELHPKIKTICVVVMMSAALEHALFIAFTWMHSPSADTFVGTIDLYLLNRYNHIFKVVPYSTLLGCMIQILNLFSTFSWNYMDLFIMAVSLTLSARFGQVTRRVQQFAKTRMINEHKWRTIREDYTRLSLLCLILDDTISNIILLSFANNLFVVLVQLFNSLQPNRSSGVIDRIYFVYSFAFLIIRTVAVALYTSTVDSESKGPARLLNTLPHQIYNVEIERFTYQIKYGPPALTGHKLFRVTRSLILSVAGAIVTYELILIQFNIH